MLFVHFTAVNNVKTIKKRGIVPGRRGAFLFPFIHGEKSLINTWSSPSWWKKGTALHDKRKAKILIKIPPGEMVEFGDWCGKTYNQDNMIPVRQLGKLIHDKLLEIEKDITQKDSDSSYKYKLLQEALSDLKDERSRDKAWPQWRRGWERLLPEIQSLAAEYSETLSLLFHFGGNEVIYHKTIPPEWILNVFVFKGSDKRVRQYQRDKAGVRRKFKPDAGVDD